MRWPLALLPVLLLAGCGKSSFDDRYARQTNRLEAEGNALQADLDHRLAIARRADRLMAGNDAAPVKP